MPKNGLRIDRESAHDNPTDRQVEFRGEVGGRSYEFAVKYSALDALNGADLLDEPAAAFPQFIDAIARAGLLAWLAARKAARVVIDEATIERARLTFGRGYGRPGFAR